MPLDGAYGTPRTHHRSQSAPGGTYVSPPPRSHGRYTPTRHSECHCGPNFILYILHPGSAATERFITATASASEVHHLLDRIAVESDS